MPKQGKTLGRLLRRGPISDRSRWDILEDTINEFIVPKLDRLVTQNLGNYQFPVVTDAEFLNGDSKSLSSFPELNWTGLPNLQETRALYFEIGDQRHFGGSPWRGRKSLWGLTKSGQHLEILIDYDLQDGCADMPHGEYTAVTPLEIKVTTTTMKRLRAKYPHLAVQIHDYILKYVVDWHAKRHKLFLESANLLEDLRMINSCLTQVQRG